MTRAFRLLVTLVGAALAVVVLIGVAPASAAVLHTFEPALTERLSEGVPPGAPGLPSGGLAGPISGANAMNAAAGELWVAEKVEDGSGGTRVDEFETGSGNFVRQLDPSAGISLTDQGVANGGFPGESAVYVGVNGTQPGEVAVYSPLSGALRATWTGAHTTNGSFVMHSGSTTPAAELAGIAVDRSSSIVDWASGDVYVATHAIELNQFPSYNVVYVLQPGAGGSEPSAPPPEIKGTCAAPGTCPGNTIPFKRPLAVAVSAVNGDVYVADDTAVGGGGEQVEPVVDVFEPTTLGNFAFVGTISGTPRGRFEHINAIAVDGGSGEVYVLNARENGGALDEFTPSLGFEGELTGPGNVPFSGPQSVAVDPASHQVFVGDNKPSTGAIDAFGPDIVVPDVAVTEPATSISPTGATLHGELNPREAGAATCAFEYGTTKSYGHTTPCSSAVANGASGVPVEATLSGLEPDGRYFYRLAGTNANGTNDGLGPEDEGTFKTTGPGIHSESVSNVTSSSATLSTVIDPNSAPTAYFFEYGRTSGYGLQSPRAPVGSGEGDISLGQHLQGLEAGALYHYRVVAVSQLAGGTFESFGADRTFTTQSPGAFTLPDGRAWEMVSPHDKHTGAILPIGEQTPIQAAANGSAISYLATAPTESDPQGYTNLMQVFSSRNPAHQRWESKDIEVPHQEATGSAPGFGEEYRLFSNDLSLAILEPFGSFDPALSEEATEQTPYLRSSYDGSTAEAQCTASCFRPLVTGANVPPGTVFGKDCKREIVICGPEFLGATSDLNYAVLRSQAALTTARVLRALYEWHGGELQLVSVLPRGEGGGPVTAGLGASDDGIPARRNAISTDGSRIVWSSGHKLYLRDMTKGATGETVRLDAAAGSAGTTPIFQFASSDGTKVFFTDTSRLTADSGAANEKPDLFECEIVEVAGALTCRLTDMTPAHAGEPADVLGLAIGASADGSYVYFAANGALAPGAERGGCVVRFPNSEAACNLYVWHNGSTKLVAVVDNGDHTDWSWDAGNIARLEWLTARVSPNGRWLAFMSRESLTGYDNRDAASGQKDEEVYLYDAQSAHLVCASCNPTGARPLGVEVGPTRRLVTGNRVWDASRWLAANIPGWTPDEASVALYQSRYLSDSGRLFFNSNDALVPQDANGNWDVYEYEPPGVGNCTPSSASYSETSGGCVGMVSSGRSSGESAFLDASETGGDVFFLTGASLAAQDFDTAPDVYDAHECSSGSPCLAAPVAAPPACTTTDACRPAPSPQPAIFGTPPSATFVGSGNLTPPGEPRPAVKPNALTKAQKLARALSACRKKPRRHRAKCQRRARATYRAKRAAAGASNGAGR